MRFQDALLLQKQQAEQEERHKEAQSRLEKVAEQVDRHFNYWLQYRDPFGESHSRIKTLYTDLTGVPSNGSSRSLHTQLTDREVTVRHLNQETDLNPTAFNLYRKLKYGQ
jgi:hypothetical protein